MKYSALPSYFGALIIFLVQFTDGSDPATNGSIYFAAITILIAVSITISTSKDLTNKT